MNKQLPRGFLCKAAISHLTSCGTVLELHLYKAMFLEKELGIHNPAIRKSDCRDSDAKEDFNNGVGLARISARSRRRRDACRTFVFGTKPDGL